MNLREIVKLASSQIASGGTQKKNTVELLLIFSLRNSLIHTFLLDISKAQLVLKDFPDHLS